MSNRTVSADRRNAAGPLIPQGARSPTVAVVIPCYNEAVAIGKVVADFRAALPDAMIYVYDNNRSDGTIEQARRPVRSCGGRLDLALAFRWCRSSSRPVWWHRQCY